MARLASIARLLALALLGVTGCGAEPPRPLTPLQDLDARHFAKATARARGAAESDAERRKITLDAAHALDPTVQVSVMTADELAKWVGTRLARRLDPSWVFLRVRTASANIDLDRVGFAFSWRASDGLVPVVPPDAEHLAQLTGETYPRGHSTYRIEGGGIPWPITILTVGVLDLLTLHTVTNTTPATEAEIRAAVPKALQFEALAAPKCRPHGVCDVFLLTRRPANEAADLRLGVSVWAEGAAGGGVALRTEIPVLPGAAIDRRLAETFAEPSHIALLGQTQMGLDKLALDECPEAPAGLGAGRCSETALVPWPAPALTPIGIVVPEGPTELGTPKSSRARAPYWASDQYAPDDAVTAGATHESTLPKGEPLLVSCALSLDGYTEDTDSIRVLVSHGKEHYQVYGTTFSLPLLRLEAKPSLSLEIYDMDTLSGDDWLANVKLGEHGGALSGSWSASKAHPERGARASVDCQVFSRSALEPLVRKIYVEAIDTAEGAGPPKADLTDISSGKDKSKLGVLRRHAQSSAALVGWDDPRTQALVERADTYELAFWRAVDESLAREPKVAFPIVVDSQRDGSFEVRAAALRCNADVKKRVVADSGLRGDGVDEGCAIDMEIANTTKSELWPCDFGRCGSATFFVELEGGRIVELADPDWAGTLDAGKSKKGTAYLKSPKPDLGKKPIRLIVRSDGHSQVFTF